MSNKNKTEFFYDSHLTEEITEPPLYNVILHNDDQTPMDFVVIIIQSIFLKNIEVAYKIMMKIHNEGAAICGVYPFDIAETKAVHVMNEARKFGYPLMSSIELQT